MADKTSSQIAAELEEERQALIKQYDITSDNRPDESLHIYLDLKESNLYKKHLKPSTNMTGDNNIDYNIRPLSGSTTKKADESDYYHNISDVPVLDMDWASSKYLVEWNSLVEGDRRRSTYSWARQKLSDSSLGNHSVINPLPQFTRYADPRVTTRIDRASVAGGTKMFANGLGMGRYYSEAIDDYQQEIYLQFGMPEFNSMLNFLLNAVTYEDAYIANHGRYPYGYGIGSWIGSKLIFTAYPWLSLTIWFVKSVAKIAFGFSPFSYYYLNPNMHMYWGSVNTIVSSMAVELGIYVPNVLDKFLANPGQADNNARMGVPVVLDSEEMKDLEALLPGLIDKNGYIDMYAIATRYQSIATKMKQYQNSLLAKLANDQGDESQGPDDGTAKLTEDGEKYLLYMNSYLIGGDGVADGKDIVKNKVNDIISKSENLNFLEKIQKDILTVETAAKSTREKVTSEYERIQRDWRTFKEYLKWVFQSKESKIGNSDNTSIGKDYAEINGGKLPKDLQNNLNLQSQQPKKKEQTTNTTSSVTVESQEAMVQRRSLDGKTQTNIKETYKDDQTGQDKKADESTSPLSEIKTSTDFDKQGPFGSIQTFTRIGDATTNLLDSGARVADAVLRDGGLFLGLRVNSTRSITDSFSNSTGPIQTGEWVKTASGAARNVRFNLSGGNLIPGVSQVINTAKDIALGVLDGATFGLSSVIASALEGAYIDLPEKWEDSKCNLGSTSYSIKLISPYGNPISQLQNIYIPLACLLAGVLPLQTGRSSHSSPYLCSVFSKGVQNIELGIITELSIERGTSNLPFSKWKQPLAIDVNFTITDLSGIVTTPINRGVLEAFLTGGLGEVGGQLTTESKLDDYIGTLCSRDLSNSRFVAPALKRRLKKATLRFKQAFNPNSAAFWIAEAFNPLAGFIGIADGETQAKTMQLNPIGGKFGSY